MKCTGVKYKGQFKCGKCMACRINDTMEKSLRGLYELSVCDCASFITLTYNDENLPRDYSLNPRDLTLFWKTLRINLQRHYKEFAPSIRYIACGEYGDKEKRYYSPGAIKPHGRPHFHAIVFGLDNFRDDDREILRKSWTKCESWFFDKERGRKSGMQEVTPDDIRYVCGYTQKKLNGQMAQDEYGSALPPFGRMSQGIGLDFAEKNKDRLLSNGFTYWKGQKVSIPRYFCKKWDVKKSDLIDIQTPDITQDDVSKLFDNFMADMHKKGFYIDESPEYWIKNSAFLERRFNEWYEKKLTEYTDLIYLEFNQRQKLRNGL